jgi:hypothetical protein
MSAQFRNERWREWYEACENSFASSGDQESANKMRAAWPDIWDGVAVYASSRGASEHPAVGGRLATTLFNWCTPDGVDRPLDRIDRRVRSRSQFAPSE